MFDEIEAIIGTAKKIKIIKRGWKNLLKDPTIIFQKNKETISFHFDMHHGYKNLEKENETKNKDTEQNEEKDDDPNVKWYVVGAPSSFEEKAVKSIQDNARKASLSHFFFDFQIPKQEVVEIKKGKKVNSKKNFFPGYILVKMIMNNQTWQLVKNSNKISGFTGNDHKPVPLSQNEVLKMLKKADDSIEYIAPKYIYEVGQQVKVIDGPFASFNGMVEEVDEEKGRLTISVSIFGRSTPVELEYTQVEKI